MQSLFTTENNQSGKAEVRSDFTNQKELLVAEKFVLLMAKFDEIVENDDFMETYYSAIDALPYMESQVMRLSYTDMGYPGLTQQEIAEYLGVETKDVKNAKKRAKRKLRKNENLKSFIQK